MNEMLKTVLSLSFSGSLLILMLFLFRPIFQERLSKRWQYYIWLVVIARLLLPFTLQTNLMGMIFQGIDKGIKRMEFAAATTQQGGILVPENEVFLETDGINGQEISQVEMLPAEKPTRSKWRMLWENLWLGWLLMALLLFIRKITVYQGFVKYIRAGCVEVADIDFLERFGNLMEQNKVKTTVELYTNNLIASPLLLGFLRPCIVLPSIELSASDFQYTILHELTHYKRLDMFYKWLVQFTICLHWFNPIVYLMGREISRTCELSCDEAIIKVLDPQQRRAYGDTLVNALKVGGRYHNSIVSLTLNESKERLKERLDAIMEFKKTTRLTAAISLTLVFVFCIGATALGAYAAPSENNVDSSASTMIAETAPFDLVFNVENCNIIILQSEDKAFRYDYDNTLYEVTSQTQDEVCTINIVSQSTKMQNSGFSDDTRIRIYVPDYTYESIKIFGNHSGISVLPLDANIELKNVKGSASVYIENGYNKNLDLTVTSGAGAIRLEEGFCDYSIDGTIEKSAFKPLKGMPESSDKTPYAYTAGNIGATMHLDIEKSAFVIETYKGNAEELLKNHYDIVF